MGTSDYTGQRAVIYARISRDKAGEALGVERQEYDCCKYAERVGLEVVEILEDNDISGYTGVRRPSFERLKQIIIDRVIDAIIYWRQDRLTRNQSEFGQLGYIAIPHGRDDSGVGLHPTTGSDQAPAAPPQRHSLTRPHNPLRGLQQSSTAPQAGLGSPD